jgi:hypothetical protein
LFELSRGHFRICEKDIPMELSMSEEFTFKERKRLEFALLHYGLLEAGELSEMSHRDDPWKPSEKTVVIPKKSMEIDYFDLWGKEADFEEEIVITKEEIECDFRAVKDAPFTAPLQKRR